MANDKNIFQRMAEVQKKVLSVNKNETVKMHENDRGYKAVTHDDVAAALHLPLAECGVFMLPDVVEYSNTQFEKTNKYGQQTTWYRTDLKIKVAWVNIDKPEDRIESTGAAFALDTSDKSFAKAYSLALKIVLLKVHLLESRDGEEQRPFDDLNNGKPQNNNNQGQNNNRQQQRPQNQNNQKNVAPPQTTNLKTQPQTDDKPKTQVFSNPDLPDIPEKPKDNAAKMAEFYNGLGLTDVFAQKQYEIGFFTVPVAFNAISDKECRDYCNWVRENAAKDGRLAKVNNKANN